MSTTLQAKGDLTKGKGLFWYTWEVSWKLFFQTEQMHFQFSQYAFVQTYTSFDVCTTRNMYSYVFSSLCFDIYKFKFRMFENICHTNL
jgi:hypothetical protein